MKKKTIAADVPRDLAAALDQIAAANGMRRAEVVREALWNLALAFRDGRSVLNTNSKDRAAVRATLRGHK